MEPSSAITGSRRLLRRLRDVMAGSGSAQERLSTIVRIIAADMVAEVCSAYLLRAGEVLVMSIPFAASSGPSNLQVGVIIRSP